MIDQRENVVQSENGRRVARLTLRIEEAAESLGISRTALYPLLRSGAIPVVRFGRSVRIPLAELERYVADQTAAQALDDKLYSYNDEAIRIPIRERRGEAARQASGADPQMASGGTPKGTRVRRGLGRTGTGARAIREASASAPT